MLFTRFKGRLFTVQRVAEFWYTEDPHFRAQPSQLYAAFCVDSGLDLRYALQVFKSEAIIIGAIRSSIVEAIGAV